MDIELRLTQLEERISNLENKGVPKVIIPQNINVESRTYLKYGNGGAKINIEEINIEEIKNDDSVK